MLDIDSVHPNVPGRAYPAWWRLDWPLADNLAEVDRWIRYYRKFMPLGTAIDEVALMGGIPVVAALRRDGWEVFNGAEDLVYTNPFGTRYTVGYTFLRRPDVPWRLEVMRVASGLSPLHRALTHGLGLPETFVAMPHLSFKPVRGYKQDPELGEEYDKETWQRSYSRAVDHMQKNAAIHAQTCQSTYGNFGYYLGNDISQQIYLKPRINLRDDA